MADFSKWRRDNLERLGLYDRAKSITRSDVIESVVGFADALIAELDKKGA